ncbi:uncharacterized threonine-rich GPI-anchored glycoprotein PJ4664.02-like, partial [Oryzias latipes]|uniref:uncharacterized threonine-rich GPI-anchored glycoprotein PJ4664.02-like n=1 Tax=Oryzias latipes TaxID=8090 RepID=UPI000CE17186
MPVTDDNGLSTMLYEGTPAPTTPQTSRASVPKTTEQNTNTEAKISSISVKSTENPLMIDAMANLKDTLITTTTALTTMASMTNTTGVNSWTDPLTYTTTHHFTNILNTSSSTTTGPPEIPATSATVYSSKSNNTPIRTTPLSIGTKSPIATALGDVKGTENRSAVTENLFNSLLSTLASETPIQNQGSATSNWTVNTFKSAASTTHETLSDTPQTTTDPQTNSALIMSSTVLTKTNDTAAFSGLTENSKGEIPWDIKDLSTDMFPSSITDVTSTDMSVTSSFHKTSIDSVFNATLANTVSGTQNTTTPTLITATSQPTTPLKNWTSKTHPTSSTGDLNLASDTAHTTVLLDTFKSPEAGKRSEINFPAFLTTRHDSTHPTSATQVYKKSTDVSVTERNYQGLAATKDSSLLSSRFPDLMVSTSDKATTSTDDHLSSTGLTTSSLPNARPNVLISTTFDSGQSTDSLSSPSATTITHSKTIGGPTISTDTPVKITARTNTGSDSKNLLPTTTSQSWLSSTTSDITTFNNPSAFTNNWTTNNIQSTLKSEPKATTDIPITTNKQLLSPKANQTTSNALIITPATDTKNSVYPTTAILRETTSMPVTDDNGLSTMLYEGTPAPTTPQTSRASVPKTTEQNTNTEAKISSTSVKSTENPLMIDAMANLKDTLITTTTALTTMASMTNTTGVNSWTDPLTYTTTHHFTNILNTSSSTTTGPPEIPATSATVYSSKSNNTPIRTTPLSIGTKSPIATALGDVKGTENRSAVTENLFNSLLSTLASETPIQNQGSATSNWTVNTFKSAASTTHETLSDTPQTTTDPQTNSALIMSSTVLTKTNDTAAFSGLAENSKGEIPRDIKDLSTDMHPSSITDVTSTDMSVTSSFHKTSIDSVFNATLANTISGTQNTTTPTLITATSQPTTPLENWTSKTHPTSSTDDLNLASDTAHTTVLLDTFKSPEAGKRSEINFPAFLTTRHDSTHPTSVTQVYKKSTDVSVTERNYQGLAATKDSSLLSSRFPDLMVSTSDKATTSTDDHLSSTGLTTSSLPNARPNVLISTTFDSGQSTDSLSSPSATTITHSKTIGGPTISTDTPVKITARTNTGSDSKNLLPTTTSQSWLSSTTSDITTFNNPSAFTNNWTTNNIQSTLKSELKATTDIPITTNKQLLSPKANQTTSDALIITPATDTKNSVYPTTAILRETTSMPVTDDNGLSTMLYEGTPAPTTPQTSRASVPKTTEQNTNTEAKISSTSVKSTENPLMIDAMANLKDTLITTTTALTTMASMTNTTGVNSWTDPLTYTTTHHFTNILNTSSSTTTGPPEIPATSATVYSSKSNNTPIRTTPLSIGTKSPIATALGDVKGTENRSAVTENLFNSLLSTLASETPIQNQGSATSNWTVNTFKSAASTTHETLSDTPQTTTDPQTNSALIMSSTVLTKTNDTAAFSGLAENSKGEIPWDIKDLSTDMFPISITDVTSTDMSVTSSFHKTSIDSVFNATLANTVSGTQNTTTPTLITATSQPTTPLENWTSKTHPTSSTDDLNLASDTAHTTVLLDTFKSPEAGKRSEINFPAFLTTRHDSTHPTSVTQVYKKSTDVSVTERNYQGLAATKDSSLLSSRFPDLMVSTSDKAITSTDDHLSSTGLTTSSLPNARPNVLISTTFDSGQSTDSLSSPSATRIIHNKTIGGPTISTDTPVKITARTNTGSDSKNLLPTTTSQSWLSSTTSDITTFNNPSAFTNNWTTNNIQSTLKSELKATTDIPITTNKQLLSPKANQTTSNALIITPATDTKNSVYPTTAILRETTSMPVTDDNGLSTMLYEGTPAPTTPQTSRASVPKTTEQNTNTEAKISSISVKSTENPLMIDAMANLKDTLITTTTALTTMASMTNTTGVNSWTDPLTYTTTHHFTNILNTSSSTTTGPPEIPATSATVYSSKSNNTPIRTTPLSIGTKSPIATALGDVKGTENRSAVTENLFNSLLSTLASETPIQNQGSATSNWTVNTFKSAASTTHETLSDTPQTTTDPQTNSALIMSSTVLTKTNDTAAFSGLTENSKGEIPWDIKDLSTDMFPSSITDVTSTDMSVTSSFHKTSIDSVFNATLANTVSGTQNTTTPTLITATSQPTTPLKNWTSKTHPTSSTGDLNLASDTAHTTVLLDTFKSPEAGKRSEINFPAFLTTRHDSTHPTSATQVYKKSTDVSVTERNYQGLAATKDSSLLSSRFPDLMVSTSDKATTSTDDHLSSTGLTTSSLPNARPNVLISTTFDSGQSTDSLSSPSATTITHSKTIGGPTISTDTPVKITPRTNTGSDSKNLLPTTTSQSWLSSTTSDITTFNNPSAFTNNWTTNNIQSTLKSELKATTDIPITTNKQLLSPKANQTTSNALIITPATDTKNSVYPTTAILRETTSMPVTDDNGLSTMLYEGTPAPTTPQTSRASVPKTTEQNTNTEAKISSTSVKSTENPLMIDAMANLKDTLITTTTALTTMASMTNTTGVNSWTDPLTYTTTHHFTNILNTSSSTTTGPPEIPATSATVYSSKSNNTPIRTTPLSIGTKSPIATALGDVKGTENRSAVTENLFNSLLSTLASETPIQNQGSATSNWTVNTFKSAASTTHETLSDTPQTTTDPQTNSALIMSSTVLTKTNDTAAFSGLAENSKGEIPRDIKDLSTDMHPSSITDVTSTDMSVTSSFHKTSIDSVFNATLANTISGTQNTTTPTLITATSQPTTPLENWTSKTHPTSSTDDLNLASDTAHTTVLLDTFKSPEAGKRSEINFPAFLTTRHDSTHPTSVTQVYKKSTDVSVTERNYQGLAATKDSSLLSSRFPDLMVSTSDKATTSTDDHLSSTGLTTSSLPNARPNVLISTTFDSGQSTDSLSSPSATTITHSKTIGGPTISTDTPVKITARTNTGSDSKNLLPTTTSQSWLSSTTSDITTFNNPSAFTNNWTTNNIQSTLKSELKATTDIPITTNKQLLSPKANQTTSDALIITPATDTKNSVYPTTAILRETTSMPVTDDNGLSTMLYEGTPAPTTPQTSRASVPKTTEQNTNTEAKISSTSVKSTENPLMIDAMANLKDTLITTTTALTTMASMTNTTGVNSWTDPLTYTTTHHFTNILNTSSSTTTGPPKIPATSATVYSSKSNNTPIRTTPLSIGTKSPIATALGDVKGTENRSAVTENLFNSLLSTLASETPIQNQGSATSNWTVNTFKSAASTTHETLSDTPQTTTDP